MRAIRSGFGGIVHPLPGVRIETLSRCWGRPGKKVHPLPGVRIETILTCPTWCRSTGSPPPGGADRNDSRSRGRPGRAGFTPSRGCGSKPKRLRQRLIPREVHPLPGVRIETKTPAPASDPAKSSPPPGGADRNFADGFRAETLLGSPPPGGADRNPMGPINGGYRTRSPPPGGADRNLSLAFSRRITSSVHPLPGVRIETPASDRMSVSVPFTPSRGCGSKRHPGRGADGGGAVHPLPGVRIETRLVAR